MPIEPEVRNTPVESVDVTFSEDIEQATFARNEDFWLESVNLGQRIALGEDVSVSRIGPGEYRIAGLGAYTGDAGRYEFHVDAAGVEDPGGEAGLGVAARRFTVDLIGPSIWQPRFSGPSRRNRPIETILIMSWDGAIDQATLTLDDVELTRDGVPLPTTGGMVVEVRESLFPVGPPNGPIPPPYATLYTYVLSGLAAYTGEPGEYRATVLMDGVSDLAGNTGLGRTPISDPFTFDPVGPWLKATVGRVLGSPLRYPVLTSPELQFNIGYTGELTREMITLTRDGAPMALPDEVRIDTSGSTDRIAGLEAATRRSGAYRLTFNPAGLVDELGNLVTEASAVSIEFVIRRGVVLGDYDGDGIADLATYLFDDEAGAGRFDIRGSSDGQDQTIALGTRGEIPVAGDFDGDGKNDVAVYNPQGRVGETDQPNAAIWTYIRSSDGQRVEVPFGGAGILDRPAPGDFDGDGTTDLATFRADSDLTPGSAEWFIRPSSDPSAGYRVAFGAAGGLDLPAVADYDGDWKDDPATYRPSPHPADFDHYDPEGDGIGAQWFLLQSAAGAARVEFGAAAGAIAGRPADQPALADWDKDGRADITAFRTASDLPGTTDQTAWFYAFSSWNDLGYTRRLSTGEAIFFALAGDLAAPADYDGDGWPELAAFNTAGRWWSIRDRQMADLRGVSFGPPGSSPNAVPVLAPLYFRLVATGNPVDGVGATGGGGDGLTRFAGAPGRPRVTGGNAPAYASLGGLAGFGLASAGSGGAAASAGASDSDREEAIDLALEDWA